MTFAATPVAGPHPAQASDQNTAGIILIALLGGLILNVMPCVLPVLSLKLFGLISATGAQRRQFRLNLLATEGGIVSFFLVIATLLILLKIAAQAIGWGIQFQQPWFLGAMAVVTTLFAANLWDWLPVSTPSFVQHAAAIGTHSHPRILAFSRECSLLFWPPLAPPPFWVPRLVLPWLVILLKLSRFSWH